ADKAEPPAYLNLDAFTVNLADTEQEHYLQATIVLQVAGEAAVEELKKHNALIRDRILKLLSSSKAADLRSVEGKQAIADQIIAQVASAADDEELEIPDIDKVFFTAFIIQ
ncbi:MAG: flagellar basal body-associated FliL family protein, partial [Pseudomonadota bacterium]|nr:flagellar basal body-associated FliL family protein [Pseudomonadota bacterium]